MENARKAQSEGWNVITATSFLRFKRTGNRTIYEREAFGRRRKLMQMVFAECLEAKGRFLDSIANGVWLICEESFWGAPAHLPGARAGTGLPDVTHPTVELFGAETGALLSWTVYLLAPQLDKISPMIVKRVRYEAERRLLGPARERNDFWWMGLSGERVQMNNWNPWINSNLLVANLLLQQDPKLRLQGIVKITKSLDAYLNQYSPDGGCSEGPGYWARSPASYFECVEALQSATGDPTGIFKNPFLGKMARYIANVHIANDFYVDFGDAHPREDPPGDLIYRYGNAIGDPQFAAFGAYCANRSGVAATGKALASKIGMSSRSMSRFLPAVLEAGKVRGARQQQGLAQDAWYPDLGLMTAREKAGSAEGLYLAVQAASNGRNHGHNDSGSFILYFDGDPVVIDVGVGTYTARTFSSERYSIWTMQSAFHNLPTVGGVMQHNGSAYKARVKDYHADGRRTELSLDLAPAYPAQAGIEVWNRKLTLDRAKGNVLVQEQFQLARRVPVELTIMTPGEPVTGANGELLLRSMAGRRNVRLQYEPAQIQPQVERIPLNDPELVEAWGNQVFRILLRSKQPVARANWPIRFVAEPSAGQ
jgi:hypothetical protein